MRAISKPAKLTCRRRMAFALIVRLLALSLAVSVASRFVHYYVMFHPAADVRCNCPDDKRQDLERDSLHWIAPVPQVAILRLLRVRLELPSKPVLRYELLSEESRYNRPPPALSPRSLS